MIASVLTLSRADCKALKIKDAYSIHKAVYSLFPQIANENRDFLFADKGGDFYARKILILSKRIPVLAGFGDIELKEIKDTFLDYDRYGFEVRINPTKREKVSGKIVPIKGQLALLNWFCEKAPKEFGFEVDKDNLQVQNIGVQSFEKDGKLLTHGEATFIGKLTVTNRTVFQSSFKDGIGRAKGFGFGLLQIIPLQS